MKKLIDQKTLAVYGVGRARELKRNPEIKELADVPLDVIANIIALTANDIINENKFNLYIAEKKVKTLNKNGNKN